MDPYKAYESESPESNDGIEQLASTFLSSLWKASIGLMLLMAFLFLAYEYIGPISNFIQQNGAMVMG